MSSVTDPISAVADSVDGLEQLIKQMSSEEHPWLYMWRILRMVRAISNQCIKNGYPAADTVGAACADLNPAIQAHILLMVNARIAKHK